MENEEIPVINNLKFNDVEWRISMGKTYAFVTAEDLGSQGKGFNPPRYKKYWGEAENGSADDIQLIMRQGAHWDNLP